MIYDRIDGREFLKDVIQLKRGCLCIHLPVNDFTRKQEENTRCISGHFLKSAVALSHRTIAFASIALVDRPISTVLIYH